MKNRLNIKRMQISSIIFITSMVMCFSSIIIYSKVYQPSYYNQFIKTANKYILEGKYEEAILTFSKAIKIEPKSTQARVEIAKAYIGIDKFDEAIEVLKEAQQIDIKNEKLLLEILEILNNVDSEIAYELLNKYINEVGQNNISQEIEVILNIANQIPIRPIVNVDQGTYIKPITIKLVSDKISVGHSFYYTIDGTEPNKNSHKYRGKINIDKDTVINLISYNSNNESSEIVSLEYKIDNDIMTKLEVLIKESKKLIENTEVGTSVGNCIEGSKEEFTKQINNIEELLSQEIISYEKAIDIENKLNKAIDNFKDNIIEQTDKIELKNLIDKANKIYSQAIEGNKDGQYKVGSKDILINSINESQNVYKNILSKQNDIDNSVNELNKAISVFNNSKVSTFTKEMALRYAIAKFGEPYEEILEHGYRLYNSYEVTSELLIEGDLRYYKIINDSDEGRGHIYELYSYENGNVIRKRALCCIPCKNEYGY